MIRFGSSIQRPDRPRVRKMRAISQDPTRSRASRGSARTRRVERNMKVFTVRDYYGELS